MASTKEVSDLLRDPAARAAIFAVSAAISIVFLVLLFLARSLWARLTRTHRHAEYAAASHFARVRQDELPSEHSPLIAGTDTSAGHRESHTSSRNDEDGGVAPLAARPPPTPPRGLDSAGTTERSPQPRPVPEPASAPQPPHHPRRSGGGGGGGSPPLVGRRPSYGSLDRTSGSVSSVEAVRGLSSPTPPQPTRAVEPSPRTLASVCDGAAQGREHIEREEALSRTRLELDTMQAVAVEARQRNAALAQELADLQVYRNEWEENVLPTLFYDLQTAAEELAEAESHMLTSVDRRQSVLKVVAAESRSQELELLSRLSALVSQAQVASARPSRRPSSTASNVTTPRPTALETSSIY